MCGISEYFKSLHVFSFGSYYLVELQWSLAHLRPRCQTTRPLSSVIRTLAHPVGRWMYPHSVCLLEWKWKTLCNFFELHLCLCIWQCQCPGRPETESRGPSILFADLKLIELVSLVWISVKLRVTPFFVSHGLNFRNTVLSAWHFDFYMRIKLGSPHLHGKVFTNWLASILTTS